MDPIVSKPSFRYFLVFLFFFALASRSFFLRRLVRFLTLSLPLLCPINAIFARFLSESKSNQLR